MRSIISTEAASSPQASLAPDVRTSVLGTEMLKSRTEAWRQRLIKLTLLLFDVTLAFLVWELTCLIEMFWAPGYLSALSVMSIVPITLVWVGLRATQGLYPGYGMNQPEELRRQTIALLATLAFAAVFALAFHVGDILSRLMIGIVFLGLLLLSPLVRHWTKGWLMRNGVWGKPVVIIGPGGAGARVEELLTREWKLGYQPVAVLNHQREGRLTEVKDRGEGMPRGDVLDEAVALTRNHRVDTLFLALPHLPREYLTNLANLASVHFHNVVIIPDLVGVHNSMVVGRDFAGTLGMEIRHSLLNPSVQRAKRALDLIATVCGGLLILPIFLLLSGLVWIELRGPIFYRDTRMGRGGKPFACLKFRTMVPEAEAVLQRILKEDQQAREEYRKYHKLRNDPRVTRVGRVLRRTSLDELPQLWNVLRGDMSLVGPRPYLPRESDEIGQTQGELLRVYPGITGPWQVSGRSNTSFEYRVNMDAYYVRNWSIWLDLVLLVRTAKALVVDRGAC